MYRLATCFWVSDCTHSTGFVGCAPKVYHLKKEKNRFIKSEAWNCWINQHNTHLNPEDITENNIDKEIENVGRLWGMDIEKRYNTMNWIHLATNGAICKVYIP